MAVIGDEARHGKYAEVEVGENHVTLKVPAEDGTSIIFAQFHRDQVEFDTVGNVVWVNDGAIPFHVGRVTVTKPKRLPISDPLYERIIAWKPREAA